MSDDAERLADFDRRLGEANDRREERIARIEAVNRELKALAAEKAALLEQAETMWREITAKEKRIDRAVSRLIAALPDSEKSRLSSAS